MRLRDLIFVCVILGCGLALGRGLVRSSHVAQTASRDGAAPGRRTGRLGIPALLERAWNRARSQRPRPRDHAAVESGPDRQGPLA